MGLAEPQIRSFTSALTKHAFAAAFLFVLPASAMASDPASQVQAQAGLEFARTLCTNCHLVEDDGGAEIVTEAPSFWEIATLEGQSEVRLRGFLTQPHAPMPTLDLSRDEIDNLVAYILSLRSSP